MWKVVQSYEKADFIKEYQNEQHNYDSVVAVDLTGRVPAACKLDELSVPEFVMDEVIILVEVDG